MLNDHDLIKKVKRCIRPDSGECEWRNSQGYCFILSEAKPCIVKEVEMEEMKVLEAKYKELWDKDSKVLDDIINNVDILMKSSRDGDAIGHLAAVIERLLKAKMSLKSFYRIKDDI